MAKKSNSFTLNIYGDAGTKEALRQLSQSARNRVMRPALSKGASIVNKAVKAELSKIKFTDTTGALRRSIGIKRYTYKGQKRAFGVVAVVGARSDVTRKDPRRRIVRQPSKYLHLVERGRRGLRGGAPMRGRPFLEAAYRSSKARAESAIGSELIVQLRAETRRAAAKSKAGAV